MTSSKDVFAKRREGYLDEAYQMALELLGAPNVGEWERKAFGWCLIDLIKRSSKNGNLQSLEQYGLQLGALEISPADDVLSKQREYALALCRPDGRLREEAKALSNRGRHGEAVAVYRRLSVAAVTDVGLQTSLAWELYRHSKQLMGAESNVNVSLVKRNLSEYLKLTVQKPSLIHSCFLQVAAKLALNKTLNILSFAKLWNLAHLRTEDFERFIVDGGKTRPSLAERVIQQAGKDAVASQSSGCLLYILPYIDSAVLRYPDNVWLKHIKAKALLALGRHDDALVFGLEVAKAKTGDYWAWELLGDIVGSDRASALSCYCKALLCSQDEKFVSKLRLKLAERLIEAGNLAEAKFEVERFIGSRERESQRIPEVAAHIVSQEWYERANVASSNDAFYRANAGGAETLLFCKLPWVSASVGERFTVTGADNKTKTKRRLFLASNAIPLEVSVSESRFEHAHLKPGDPIKIKGEFDTQNRFQVLMIDLRPDGDMWDVFPKMVGVVDQVNDERKVAHFIVERGIDGLIPFSVLSSGLKAGDAVSMKLARYSSSLGCRYRVLQAERTIEEPGHAVRKAFASSVRAEREMGFTADEVFVPPPLMRSEAISDGDFISGIAILSFNKKRSTWGWKAVSVSKTVESAVE